MTTITEVAERIQGICGETAARLGRETGFIQGERVLTGSSYAQTLVFGWLSNPASTMSELSQTAHSLGTAISKQGLQERFSEASARFMQALLETALGQLVEAEAGGQEVLARFSYVHVIDSTTVRLPDELAHVWSSCGGSGGSAALKINLAWDLQRADCAVN
jgi:hypothetical protein